MPHRAGYFVLAYAWDHHCHDLIESLRLNYLRVERALAELGQEDGDGLEPLLNYYKKWHYNKELYDLNTGNIERRQFVINDLGYRGYGVNRDLLTALETLKTEYADRLFKLLEQHFRRKTHVVMRHIYLPKELSDSFRSDYIIVELSKRLGLAPEKEVPRATGPVRLDLDRYFQVMSKETAWQTNTAIFQKLFFKMGTSSMTIMKGTTGLHDTRSAQELKALGNRNLAETCAEVFSGLHTFTDIGADLLKRIHFCLSRELDPEAGNFRCIDFPDRNGVTFEFGNFEKEVHDLELVLAETAQSFHDLNRFIFNLSRSYYMVIAIHPFWDSNGRAGRTFLNYLLLKKGIPPINFNEAEEIFALPRYGGSMEEMHEYVKRGVVKAVDAYLYERWKLNAFGFLQKQVYNVSFDSGFHFQQIDDRVQRLEVHFDACVIDRAHPLFLAFQEQSRVVFPDEQSLRSMFLYGGFSNGQSGEWEETFRLQHAFFIKEIASDTEGVRIFDVDLVQELTERQRGYAYFACSVVSEEGGLIFNNKGLNYIYRLQA